MPVNVAVRRSRFGVHQRRRHAEGIADARRDAGRIDVVVAVEIPQRQRERGSAGAMRDAGAEQRFVRVARFDVADLGELIAAAVVGKPRALVSE